MKNNKKTVKEMDIVFLLDRSGSMSGSEKDTIGGYNSFLDKQRKSKYNTKITTVLFDNEYELLHNRVDISKVNKITEKEYYVRGCTALLDAIGKTINNIDKKVKNNKVLFVITTDGEENASCEYTKEKVKQLIESHSNWEFIYLGANIDSYKESSSIGISIKNTANYQKSKKGTSKMFEGVNRLCQAMILDEDINEAWKQDIEDFE